MDWGLGDLGIRDWGIGVLTKLILNFPSFHCIGPLGRISLYVVMSVTCLSICPLLETLNPRGLETSGHREYC